MNFTAFTPPVFYKYRLTVRVDPWGNGDVTNLPDAISIINSYGSDIDMFNRARIEVPDNVFEGGPYIIPAWTSLMKPEGVARINNFTGAIFIRSTTTAPDPSETYLFYLNEGSSMYGICGRQEIHPPEYDTNYSIVRMSPGLHVLQDCVLHQMGNTYVSEGPLNPLYGVYMEGDSQNVITYSGIFSRGENTISVCAPEENTELRVSYTNFAGDPQGVIEYLNTTPNRALRVQYSVLHGEYDNIILTTNTTLDWLIKTEPLSEVQLVGTSCRLDDRVGGGIYYEEHETNQQLQIGIKATSKTVSANYTIDGYYDGTIRADTTLGNLDITLPPISECIVGQIFVVKNVGANTTNIDSDSGVLIDGALTTSIPTLNDALKFQLNDLLTWDIL